jgi:hypothetical protein
MLICPFENEEWSGLITIDGSITKHFLTEFSIPRFCFREINISLRAPPTAYAKYFIASCVIEKHARLSTRPDHA